MVACCAAVCYHAWPGRVLLGQPDSLALLASSRGQQGICDEAGRLQSMYERHVLTLPGSSRTFAVLVQESLQAMPTRSSLQMVPS